MGKVMGLIVKAKKRQAQVDAENAQVKKGQLEMEAIQTLLKISLPESIAYKTVVERLTEIIV